MADPHPQLDSIMDQRSATWRDLGRQVPVSGMDLMILVNLASIGVSHLLSAFPDGTEADARAIKMRDRVTNNVVRAFTAGRGYKAEAVALSLALDGTAVINDRFQTFLACKDPLQPPTPPEDRT